MLESALIPAFEARLDLDQLEWRATSTPGVAWILVSPTWERFKAGANDGEVVALIRMEAGCGYPAHRHLGAEEVLILQGGYRDELQSSQQIQSAGASPAPGEPAVEHRAGTWLRYPAGSSHAPVALEGGPCVLFATARGGVELLDRPAFIKNDSSAS